MSDVAAALELVRRKTMQGATAVMHDVFLDGRPLGLVSSWSEGPWHAYGLENRELGDRAGYESAEEAALALL